MPANYQLLTVAKNRDGSWYVTMAHVEDDDVVRGEGPNPAAALSDAWLKVFEQNGALTYE